MNIPSKSQVLKDAEEYLRYDMVRREALHRLLKVRREQPPFTAIYELRAPQWTRELSTLCKELFGYRNDYAQLVTGTGHPNTFRRRQAELIEGLLGASATALACAEFLIAHTCRHCGCTDQSACEGGCSWIESGLCGSPDCVAKDKEQSHLQVLELAQKEASDAGA